jgi:hypothetical protein
MSCRKCGSEQLSKFASEINIHFPAHEGLDKAPVLIFPELLVCLRCGFAELFISKKELSTLVLGVGR